MSEEQRIDELIERLRTAMFAVRQYDNSTFHLEFEPEHQKFMEIRDKLHLIPIALIELAIEVAEGCAGDFKVLEQKSNHGKVQVSYPSFSNRAAKVAKKKCVKIEKVCNELKEKFVGSDQDEILHDIISDFAKEVGKIFDRLNVYLGEA